MNSHICLVNNEELLLEYYERLIKLSDNEIIMAIKGQNMIVTGDKIYIDYYDHHAVLIRGKIREISFSK